MAALKKFTVRHKDITLKVRVLRSVKHVNREFKKGNSSRLGKGQIAYSFFAPSFKASAKHVGTVVFPWDEQLIELVPHEVTHAVLHKYEGVLRSDDEAFATAVGMLSAQIIKRIGVSI